MNRLPRKIKKKVKAKMLELCERPATDKIKIPKYSIENIFNFVKWKFKVRRVQLQIDFEDIKIEYPINKPNIYTNE